jgi:hypothetical protein
MAESVEARCKSFPGQSAGAWRGVRGARGVDFNSTMGRTQARKVELRISIAGYVGFANACKAHARAVEAGRSLSQRSVRGGIL